MFLDLTKRMLERAEEHQAENDTLSRTNSHRKNVVVVEDDQVPQKTTKNCCGTT